MECIRAKLDNVRKVMYTVPIFCTMINFTYLCGLKRANGLPKWPSLEELCKFALGEVSGRKGYHSAEQDASMTARCFFAVCGNQIH